MGKKAKEHRKKVKARNERMKGEERAVEKLRRQIFEEAKQRYLNEQENKNKELWNTNSK
jgi:hypothetical protein